LQLNIKGIGYILHHAVYLPPSQQPLNHSELNGLNFGDMYVNEKRYKRIVIENLGDFNFDYVINKNS
jgi:hypothetical protein